MSTKIDYNEAEAAEAMMCCANCGKAEVDEIKLKFCTACKLVKYCSVDCQKNHQSKHKTACKKSAAELRDDKLFTQPDGTHLGECPICCLPLPLDAKQRVINSCCCKRICRGCDWANKKREIEQGLDQRCPYCREPMPTSQEEIDQNYMERAEANDPFALFYIGVKHYHNEEFDSAFEYYTKAAGLGFMMAHFSLSNMYLKGEGVEKNKKKEIYHLEEAAIGGHPDARCNLGVNEWKSGRIDRAMKHVIIAAKLGRDDALDAVKEYFVAGIASKEDYEAALRGHQAAVDATKSQQRDAAEEHDKQQNQED